MARVFAGERHFLGRARSDRTLDLQITDVDPTHEMSWKAYAVAMFVFNIAGGILLAGDGADAAVAALLTRSTCPTFLSHSPNTATSFMTNTNWQAYSGESTMSYFTQMAGLAVHNFVSAATGTAIAVALMRGLVRKESNTIGNFWTDLTRCTLYICCHCRSCSRSPRRSRVWSKALTVIRQPQRSRARRSKSRSDQPPRRLRSNSSARMVADFFGQNSAHPFENPTPLSNFIEVFVIFPIASALVYMFGLMARDRREGWAIWAAMFVLFLAGFAALWWAELQHNPAIGLTASLEGKEVSFWRINSALFATVTTDASCGAVNWMHDSSRPWADSSC